MECKSRSSKKGCSSTLTSIDAFSYGNDEQSQVSHCRHGILGRNVLAGVECVCQELRQTTIGCQGSTEAAAHIVFHQTSWLSSNHQVCPACFPLCQCLAPVWLTGRLAVRVSFEQRGLQVASRVEDQVVVLLESPAARTSRFRSFCYLLDRCGICSWRVDATVFQHHH